MENAKLVRGIWFPEHDKHLAGMVEKHSKQPWVTLGDGRRVGTYQKHKLDYALERLSADRRRRAIDVGAHIGLWSMHLLDQFKAVEAFEPLEAHWTLLAENVRHSKRCRMYRAALGAKRGEVEIVSDPINTGNSHAVGSDADSLEAVAFQERERLRIDKDTDNDNPDTAVKIHTVPLRTLDSYKFDDVDFIKIDVEGLEHDVLKGARRTIAKCKPMIVVEQKGNEQKFFDTPRNAATDYLLGMGMVLVKNYGGDHIMDWPK